MINITYGIHDNSNAQASLFTICNALCMRLWIKAYIKPILKNRLIHITMTMDFGYLDFQMDGQV